MSDRERDEAVDRLAQAATDGRLTLEEYSERAGRALTARTRDDLAPLTYDLGEPAAERQPDREVADAHRPELAERLVAVFGSEVRRGRWSLPERVSGLAVFGECRIDLCDATLHARVTVIDARAFFGSVEILVPDGVHVRMTGMSIFGSSSCTVRAAPPGAPVLEIRGHAVFGEVSVRRPRGRDGIRGLVGEVVKDAIDNQLYRKRA